MKRGLLKIARVGFFVISQCVLNRQVSRSSCEGVDYKMFSLKR